METVWVVFRGEDYEGGEIEGIFSSYEKARKWTLENIVNHSEHRRGWKEVSKNHWKRGCDNVSISEHELDKPDDAD